MKELINQDYIPGIPEYIQDIILIQRFRNALCEGYRPHFDWYVDYFSFNT